MLRTRRHGRLGQRHHLVGGALGPRRPLVVLFGHLVEEVVQLPLGDAGPARHPLLHRRRRDRGQRRGRLITAPRLHPVGAGLLARRGLGIQGAPLIVELGVGRDARGRVEKLGLPRPLAGHRPDGGLGEPREAPQGLPHLLEAAEALLRKGPHGPHQHRAQVAGDLGDVVDPRAHLAAPQPGQALGVIRRAEGVLAGEALEDQHPQGEDQGALVEGLTPHQLGRGVDQILFHAHVGQKLPQLDRLAASGALDHARLEGLDAVERVAHHWDR